MNALMDFEVTCPYCGEKNTIDPDCLKGDGPHVILCDIEYIPGCDRYFAFSVTFKPMVTTYKMTETHDG
jgi:hypothetical protein